MIHHGIIPTGIMVFPWNLVFLPVMLFPYFQRDKVGVRTAEMVITGWTHEGKNKMYCTGEAVWMQRNVVDG